MFRLSLLLFCILASPNIRAEQDTDPEAEFDETTPAILRDTFAKPLYSELIGSGLAPLLAESETNRLLKGLTDCWNSKMNEVDSEETAAKTLHLGGQTLVAYDTPCLQAFLTAVDHAKP